MKQATMAVMMMAAAVMLLLPITTGYAQMTPLTPASELYTSEDGGYSLQIPQGWVIEDGGIIQVNDDPTVEGIAILCLQNEALPDVGGEYNCQAANTTDTIHILRYPDLQSNPELENVENITTNDLLALRIQELQNYSSAQNIQIENVTDNVVNGQEKKILDMTYTGTNRAGTLFPFDDYTFQGVNSVMFVLAEDKNTGYAAINPRSQGEPKPEAVLQQVFDSFELIE